MPAFAKVTTPLPEIEIQRLRILIRGAVQGVGFRPFVYRLATDAGLAGWVNNSPQGVCIEVEGPAQRLETFLTALEREKPPRASIQSLEPLVLDPVGYRGFAIRPSEEGGGRSALILPDIATCPDCLREMFDPHDRRYRYPFINCTNCGPRFSIVEGLPYDRPNTTMRDFVMCPACRAEYEDPRNRRFHAQPIACPACGPHLEAWRPDGTVLATQEAALQEALAAIGRGEIVAVKGLGGFHLLVDARDDAAVQRLRRRKHREEKPFALMFPRLAAVSHECLVAPLEARLLTAAEAPIVLLRRAPGPSEIAPSVAPGNPYLGAMLPYTPLHHLLLAKLGHAVVATSGNVSDEPICIDEREALDRLGGIADLFLVHDRPIARHVDDSVVCVVLDREMLLRRARGYAPLPIHLPAALPPLLAVGGHLKNSVALAVGQDVFISQHIGDLETLPATRAFERVIADFKRLYAVVPSGVVCDAHPDYASTAYAERTGLPLIRVQHHLAHVMACLAENEVAPPALGVSWDGTGYGLDGTIWGGEFFTIDGPIARRAAHLRPWALPGGDQAVKEPRRTALSLLYEQYGTAGFAQGDLAPVRACSPQEMGILQTMLERGINSPRTSSMGRLFDAVAALLGLQQEVRFEGQAAMALEWAMPALPPSDAYPLDVRPAHAPGDPLILDWGPLLDALLRDIRRHVAPGLCAARFHNALVEAIVTVAQRLGYEQVALSGGCFQNRYLLTRAVLRLREAGFRPYRHQRVPPNDGGLALGQLVAAVQIKEVQDVSGRSR